MTQPQWETLARQFQDTVYRVAWSCLQNPQDAQDVTQEVLLKLLECERSFRDEAHVRAWLVRVTVNQCRDCLRSPWHRRTALSGNEASSNEESQTLDSLSLSEALARLDAKSRLAIHLYYYEGCGAKEIAALTGSSPAAVRQRLSRARKQLRELLKEDIEL